MDFIQQYKAFQERILESPDMKGTYIAVYHALFTINNRYRWARVFPVDYGLALELSRVDKSTYYKALDYFAANGFFDSYVKGKSKYTRAQISLKVLYDKSHSEPDSNQERSSQSTSEHLTKPLNNKTNKPINTKTEAELFSSETDPYSFEFFWNLYDKKVGKKEKLQKKWDDVKIEDRKQIFAHVPLYKISQPDKKFRKNPETYLNNASWMDELINKPHGKENRSTTKIISTATIPDEEYYEPL